MFNAAQFTTARTWKQPECPLTDEWIKRMWYAYTIKYYLAVKKKIGSLTVMWMNPDSSIQSDGTQKEKNKYRIVTCIYRI